MECKTVLLKHWHCLIAEAEKQRMATVAGAMSDSLPAPSEPTIPEEPAAECAAVARAEPSQGDLAPREPSHSSLQDIAADDQSDDLSVNRSEDSSPDISRRDDLPCSFRQPACLRAAQGKPRDIKIAPSPSAPGEGDDSPRALVGAAVADGSDASCDDDDEDAAEREANVTVSGGVAGGLAMHAPESPVVSRQNRYVVVIAIETSTTL